MRDLDLDAVKKELRGFFYNGNRHAVYQPSMRQILVHEDKLRQLRKDVDKFNKKTDEKSQKELDALWREFLIFEVCHFVPSLSREDVLDMTPEQRAAIMDIVKGVTPDEQTEDGSKKKKTKK